MSDVDVLAKHQRGELGMTMTTPDRCKCGAKVFPSTAWDDFGRVDIMTRRDFAFAQHQIDALRAGR